MRVSRKLILPALPTIALSMVVAGCNSSGSSGGGAAGTPQNPDQVKAALNAQGPAPAPVTPPTATSPTPVLVRAAATIGTSHTKMFQDMKKAFQAANQPFTWVEYDSYPNMYLAQQKGEVDIVFNGPFAHAKALLATNYQACSVVMRDVDASYSIVLVTKTTSGINSISDLSGKTLGLPVAVGCTDPGGNISALYWLYMNGADFNNITVADYTGMIDSDGNSVAGDTFVLNAFLANQGLDAICIGSDTWAKNQSNPNLKAVFTSPTMTHCTWTSLPSSNQAAVKIFHDALLTSAQNQSALDDGSTASWVEGQNNFSAYTQALQLAASPNAWCPKRITPVMPPGAPSGSPASGAPAFYFPAGGATGTGTIYATNNQVPSFASAAETNTTSGISRYMGLQGTPIVCKVYDEDLSMVDAQLAGKIDIGWHMPSGHARMIIRTANACQGILCRDVDVNSYSEISVNANSSITSIADLNSGSAVLEVASQPSDAAEASILPLHFLKKAGTDISHITITNVADTFGLTMLGDVIKSSGPLACATGFEAPQYETPAGATKAIWKSPNFNHCMMTALDTVDATKIATFVNSMINMKNNPDFKKFVLVQNEGAQAWVAGTGHDKTPYQDLIDAISEFSWPVAPDPLVYNLTGPW